MVIALAGRRIDSPDAATARFPAANVPAVKAQLHDLFHKTAASALVSSAACGADLVALEEAGRMGLRRRVVLPANKEEFRENSVVDDGRPADWGLFYDRITTDVGAADDLVVLQDQPAGDAPFVAANSRILDEAVALGRATNENVLAVLVWEGRSRGLGDLTEAFGAAARERGLPVTEVYTLGPNGE
jgi:hypothetical protein